MADANLTLREVTDASGTTDTVSVLSSSTTAVGDYVVVVADVDYQSSASQLVIGAAAGVGDGTVNAWTPIVTGDDSAIIVIKAWLGRVTTAGARTIPVSQGAGIGGGLEMHCYTYDPGGGTVTVDGTPTAITNRTSPFVHGAVTAVGTKSTLICAHGQVQFNGTSLYGSPPSGMTVGKATYTNQYCGIQSCYQQLSTSGATGTRTQTSTPAAANSGAAGIMFALRNDVPTPRPTLVASYPILADKAAPSTAAFTPVAGELLVVKAVTGNASTITISSVTSSWSTLNTGWSATTNTSVASQCAVALWNAPVPASPVSMTVTVTFSTYSATVPARFIVERWANAKVASPPASNATRYVTTAAAPSTTLTTVAANSVVTTVCADYNGTTGTPAYRSSAVEIDQYFSSGKLRMSTFYQATTTAGSQTIGMTAPSQKWSMIGWELQYSATGTLVPPTVLPGAYFHVLGI